MTEYSYPFNSQTVTETQFRGWARQFAGSHVHSGLTVANVTGARQLTVQPGFATVDGTAYWLDTQLTLSGSTNTSGGTRRDWVVIILDPSKASGSKTSITLRAGSGTSTPSWKMTQAGVYELPIAYADLPNGGAAYSTPVSVAPPAMSDWDFGVWSGATNSNGDITINLHGTHSTAPTIAVVTDQQTSAALVNLPIIHVLSLTNTGINVHVTRSDTNAAFALNPVSCHWLAIWS